ncbi:MAG TPA: methyltransferase [Candidatus Limnocylindrales bacterium]
MATFDERAAEWDTPERIARAADVADALVGAVDIRAGTRAIELGAGTGLLGLAIRDRVGPDRLAGLLLTDPSTGMLEVAAAKIRDRGLAGVATARYELGTDPPPAGAPFDLAVSVLMLHHVEDTAAALRSVRELLVPGGRLALADLDTEDGSFHTAEAEGIHHHGFDRHLLQALAERAGFREVEIGSAGSMERDGRTYPLFLLTATAA